MVECQREPYNARLFERSKLRSYYHNWRFDWFRDALKRHVDPNQAIRLFELGCFDGRLVSYLDPAPERYVGFDADWEGGLSQAMARDWGDLNAQFRNSRDPADLAIFENGEFNTAAALETMEHIDPHLVDDYLNNIARVLDGHLFVSVPNEKGVVFLMKHIAKKLLNARSGANYSLSDVVNLTLGRTSRVERNDHKGFCFDTLRDQISKHFDIIEIQGGPITFLPHRLNLTVAFVARARNPSRQQLSPRK